MRRVLRIADKRAAEPHGTTNTQTFISLYFIWALRRGLHVRTTHRDFMMNNLDIRTLDFRHTMRTVSQHFFI